MRKLIALILAALLTLTALCGCNILEAGEAPTMPKLGYDEVLKKWRNVAMLERRSDAERFQ